MISIKSIFFLKILLISINISCCSQIIQQNHLTDTNKITLLKGKFLLYRREIKIIDADNLPPRQYYETIYVDSISENIISQLLIMDTMGNEFAFIEKPWNGMVINNKKESDSIYEYVRKKYTFSGIESYKIFNYQAIPQFIVESDNRFVAIYEGEIVAIGPFNTFNFLTVEGQLNDGYFYLPDKRNSLKYLYTIILPPINE